MMEWNDSDLRYFHRIGIDVQELPKPEPTPEPILKPTVFGSRFNLLKIVTVAIVFDLWLALVIWGACEGYKHVGR